SGAMFFPKTRPVAAHLSTLFKDGGVEKRYWALVSGTLTEQQWRLETPIAKVGTSRDGVAEPGKQAITEFRLLAAGNGVSLVEARPITGRTHQIRVHLAHLGLPILGDTTYGGESAPRLMLHCRLLAIKDRQGERLEVVAPVDDPFHHACCQAQIDVGFWMMK
ncbi:MAG TPA: RNA pseudouridine synthase, partial [Geobacterales bacterium]|nr:RNA pseudouridine synthase [Geobacterales bacterium]